MAVNEKIGESAKRAVEGGDAGFQTAVGNFT